MKKLLIALIATAFASTVLAQATPATPAKGMEAKKAESATPPAKAAAKTEKKKVAKAKTKTKTKAKMEDKKEDKKDK